MNNILKKTKNKIIYLNKYFTKFEKIWLISLILAGILTTILAPKLFPEDYDSTRWVQIVSLITLVGGCSCELLLSKQSRWAYIVSFFLYDLTQTAIYAHEKLYVDIITEVCFWMPLLFISFFNWSKHKDNENKELTKVRKLTWSQGGIVAILIALFSLGFGLWSYSMGGNYPFLDALGSAFNVANGLFLIFRYREQWFAWYVVAIVEAIIWTLSGQYVMLILSIGYLTNTTYGLLKWNKYAKTHKEIESK